MKKLKHLATDQRGMASIIVAVTLMLIISLIVLAMSQNTQNEQRQALDRQLSDQAFYNAETGINDVAYYLYNTPTAPVDKTQCAGSLGDISNQIDGSDGVNKYTCVLYDKAPKSLQYDNVSISSPKIIPIQTVNDSGAAAILQRLTIAWDDTSGRDGDISGSCNFGSGSPALPTSCDYGGVRVEVIRPAPNRDVMRQSSLIAFLLPNNGPVGGDIAVGALGYPDNQGLIEATNCSNPDTSKRRCSKTITQIGTGNLYLSIRSLYRPVNVTITGVDGSNSALRFKDTQTVVDSTGKANDVLRRVQVRIPAKAQYVYPGYALQSKDSICKVLNVSRDDAGVGNVATADSAACPLD
jgi:hypothetical protein